jgi:hypothetical protein
MAQICREIQERIETTRNEAREECRNVSRTITETICSWMPWPLDELCDLVTRVITEVVCTIVWVAVTVVSWVTRIVCETINLAVFIIEHVIGLAEWLAGRILSLPELLLCLVGVKPGRKRYHLCPIVIADEAGNPVVPLATITAQIARATTIYNACSIDVIALPITVVTGRAHLAQAPGCDFLGYFSGDRTEYEHLSCCTGLVESVRCLRFPSGFIWPRHVLKAIWVREIAGNAVGCTMLPESFVLIDADASPESLAHEMGHAGDLLHSSDPTNIMAPGTIRTAANLTSAQCCAIRSSRFVTFL